MEWFVRLDVRGKAGVREHHNRIARWQTGHPQGARGTTQGKASTSLGLAKYASNAEKNTFAAPDLLVSLVPENWSGAQHARTLWSGVVGHTAESIAMLGLKRGRVVRSAAQANPETPHFRRGAALVMAGRPHPTARYYRQASPCDLYSVQSILGI